MNDKCLIIEQGNDDCLSCFYNDYIDINFYIYNNSFYNYANLKLILCLNDYIEIIKLSDNLDNNIYKNKIITELRDFKSHMKIEYSLKLKILLFNTCNIKIIITDNEYNVLSKKTICLT